MRKLISFFIVAGMLSLVACGPSAEELAVKEQARLDSIAQVEAELLELARLDSIAQAEEEARLAAEAAAKAKGSKTTTTKTPETKAPEKTKTPQTGEGGRRGNEVQQQETGAGGRRTGN